MDRLDRIIQHLKSTSDRSLTEQSAMTLQSCTVVIDKGKEPTEEFLKAFVAKYPTALTAVIIRDIKAEKPCEILPPIKDYSAKDILDLIKEEDVIGERKVLWACNSSETIAEEDMQPFDILVDGEGVKHLVAFAEGDFTGFVKAESSLSPEMHAMQEYLVPYVEGLCAGLDDNVDDVIKELKKPESMKKLEGELFSAQRGTVVLVGPGIVEILQNKNPQDLNAPWGWSADNCEPPRAVEKTSKFARPGKVVIPPNPNTITNVKDEDGVWVKAPAIIQGNTATKLWYKGVFGKDKIGR